jgi:putative ABC transport system permease protein
MGLMTRLKNLWRADRLGGELEEELRSHVEMRAEANQAAGMNHEEARQAAQRQFGNAMRLKEQTLEADLVGWLDTMKRDVRYGVRMLRRSPGFTAVAVLTLALGIGANTAIFSVVNAVLLKPLPFKNAERLVWAWGQLPVGNRAAIAPMDFTDYRRENHTFEKMGAFGMGPLLFNLVTGDKPELVKGGMVTAGFFDTLGLQPVYGRLFDEADEQVNEPETVILGQRFWKERFGGDPRIVGQTLKVDGRNRTVVGVLPVDLPLFGSQASGMPTKTALWIAAPYRNDGMRSRRAHFFRLVGLLKAGVTAGQAESDLNTINDRIAREFRSEATPDYHLALVPLKAALVGDTREALLILLAAVSLVLLIACTNVANILSARNTTRQKEMALRTALGAGRGQIARQVLTESLLLASLGAAAAVALAMYGIRFLRVTAAGHLPRVEEVEISGTVLLFTAGIAVLTGVLFGLAPALALSRVDPAENLKVGGGSGGSKSKHRTQRLLMVAEVSLSVIVLIAAGLVLNSFWRVVHVNPGFDPSQVTTAQISLVYEKYKAEAQRIEFFDRVNAGIEALPGVEAAGFVSELPLSGQANDTFFTIREHPLPNPKDTNDADVRVVSGNYFQTMRIPVLEGREFRRQDTRESPKVVLVNDALAKQYFPGESAVGKHLEIFEGQPNFTLREIVGVVGGNKHFALQESPRPQLFEPYAQSPFLSMNMVVRGSADRLTVAPAVREALQKVDADEAWSAFRVMNEVVSESASEDRMNAMLLATFGLIALLLAAVGIFGLLSYLVTQKTREIGIRMALGSTPSGVLQMVVGEGMKLTAAGMAIGLAAAFGVTRWMSSLLYGVKASDRLTFSAVALLLAGVAFLACWLPARRATRVDPLVALRHE